MTDPTPQAADTVRLDADQLRLLAAEVARQLADWLATRTPGQIPIDDPLAGAGQQVSPPTGAAVTIEFPQPPAEPAA
ncbi:hypothetical protein ACIA8O_35020 [Kitasatospora sp. NPDC051853]|uniref:hypothetical protein n=1 Tax=Kitasatospora sp. NPDC051853 TaxID=3364058 RepID=UPI003794B426